MLSCPEVKAVPDIHTEIPGANTLVAGGYSLCTLVPDRGGWSRIERNEFMYKEDGSLKADSSIFGSRQLAFNRGGRVPRIFRSFLVILCCLCRLSRVVGQSLQTISSQIL